MSVFNAVMFAAATALMICGGAVNAEAAVDLNARPRTRANPLGYEISQLRDGQTLQLQESEIQLSETLFVKASNVAIYGAAGMTHLRCPDEGAALVLSGTNVTLKDLIFTDCTSGPALTVDNSHSAFLPSKNNHPSNELEVDNEGPQYTASIQSCRFTQNEHSEGAALVVRNARMLLVDSMYHHNHATDGGGGVYANTSSLDVINTSFESNTATKNGGAIMAQNSSMTMTNVSFIGNKASQGGALWVQDSDGVSISDCVFSSNSAERKAGAIDIYRCKSASLEQSTFTNNVAGDNGGAIQVRESDLNINEDHFTGNVAARIAGAIDIFQCKSVTFDKSSFMNNTAGESAGAIRIRESEGKIDSSTFSENSAKKPGGAVVIHMCEAVAVENCTFVHNMAGENGGAIRVQYSNMNLDGSSFDENSSGLLGGAVAIKATNASLKHSTFKRNTAAKNGGALRAQEGNVSMNDVRFVDNVAKEVGGALAIWLCPNVTVRKSSFTNNTATMGGAFNAHESNVRVEDSSFSKNSAQTIGGAIRMILNENATVKDSIFVKNTAQEGGAFFVEMSDAIIEGSHFTENSAHEVGGAADFSWCEAAFVKHSGFASNKAQEGGALFAEKSGVTVEDSNFAENVAHQVGGAINVYRCETGSVTQCEFLNNRAQKGGALSVEKTDVIIKESNFTENLAHEVGGAIDISWCESATVMHSLFVNNTAQEGGAFFVEKSDAIIEGSNFTENLAHEVGGAIDISWCESATVMHSLFVNNTARIGGAVFGKKSDAIIEGSKFTENVAHEVGGAIHFYQCETAEVKHSEFLNNAARMGGALDAEASLAAVRSGTFSGNNAASDGGAMSLRGLFNATVLNSEFTNNSAPRGGAIRLEGRLRLKGGHFVLLSEFRSDPEESSERTSESILMVDAVQLVNNRAKEGGAIHLDGEARLQSKQSEKLSIRFVDNMAMDGGALFCENCVLLLRGRTEYVGNIALATGGGVCLKSGQNVTMDCAQFRQNIAASGGAIKIDACESFILGASSECETSFSGNVALEGGAVHIEPGNLGNNAYRVQHSLFERNQALAADALSSTKTTPALVRWFEARKEVTPGEDGSPSNCTSCRLGKGGAIFVSFREISEHASVSVSLGNLTVTENTASLGGGSCFEISASDSRRGVAHLCSAGERDGLGCNLVDFSRIQLTDNSATAAGGGLFMRGSHNPTSFCTGEPFQPAEGAEPQNSNHCFAAHGNTVDEGGYGPDFATDAASLHWKNLNGCLEGLRTGDNLAKGTSCGSNDGQTSSPGLLVEVWDAVKQIITTGPDSNLRVLLTCNRTFGASRYRAQVGMINIDSTTVLGINISDTLSLQSDDGRNISTELTIRMKPCEEGEIEGPLNHTCCHCGPHLYTFHSEHDCMPCEEHATCDKTTALVPDKGYWHSTPFSPVMRRCPAKKACSGEKRNETLFEYYKELSFIKYKLKELDESKDSINISHYKDYRQCAKGYEGVLCGECEPGYGHNPGGKCRECSRGLASTRFLTAVVTFLLFCVISVKLFLEVQGVRSDVSFEILRQKRDTRAVLDDAVRQLPSAEASGTQQEEAECTRGVLSTDLQDRFPEQLPATEASSAQQEEAERTRGDAHRDTPSEMQTPTVAETFVEIVQGKGPSRTESQIDARGSFALTRTEERVREPIKEELENAVPEDVKDVAGVLSETFNILFNYMQLNSVALYLDVDWKGAVKKLLSIQSSVGRLMKTAFYPLDCCFSDRNHDRGIPNSILVLIFRAAFPLVSACIYGLVIQALSCTSWGQQGSESGLDLIPPMRLVLSVVYFAYCIDVVSDLVRIMDCIHLQPAPADHPYADYEIRPAEYVWAEDTSITCWKGFHLVLTVFSSVGLILSLAFIVFMIRVLYKAKKQGQLRKPKFLLNYGFLYLKYRTDGMALYWESVITMRRMLFAAIGVYFQFKDTVNAEIGLLAIVMVIVIVLQEIVKPFDHDNPESSFPSYGGWILQRFGFGGLAERWVDFNQYITLNGLEGASLFMSLSLFLTAMSVNGDAGDDASTTQEYILLLACLFLNSLYFCFMVYRIWCCAHCYLDIVAREKSVKFQGGANVLEDNNTWLGWKAWILFLRPRAETSQETAPLMPTLE